MVSGDWVERQRKIFNQSVSRKVKKKTKTSARILKTEQSCKRYQVSVAFQKAQTQEERQRCLAGVPGSHPTCRQGRRGSHVPSQVGAGGSRWEPLGAVGSPWEPLAAVGRRWEPLGAGAAEARRCGQVLGSGCSGGRRSWAVPQFPVQLDCCCFSSAGKKPSREMTITSS